MLSYDKISNLLCLLQLLSCTKKWEVCYMRHRQVSGHLSFLFSICSQFPIPDYSPSIRQSLYTLSCRPVTSNCRRNSVCPARLWEAVPDFTLQITLSDAALPKEDVKVQPTKKSDVLQSFMSKKKSICFTYKPVPILTTSYCK